MKRSVLILLCAVLGLVSCIRVEDDINVQLGRKIAAFTARIDNDHTRTHSVLTEDGALNIYWHKDDCVAVTDGTKLAKFNLDSGADSATATFVVASESESVAFAEGKTLYGVSPYSAATFYADYANVALQPLVVKNLDWDESGARAAAADEYSFGGVLLVTIPSEQTYTGLVGENDLDRNVMIGTTADDGASFDFVMVASAARFSIAVGQEEKIYSVKMTAEDAYVAGMSKVDVSAMAIDAASSKSVTLTYATPQVGSTDEGWALVTPVDWTQSNGKVLYEVVTNKGIYTFCKRPTKAFEPGFIYNFPLSVENFKSVESKELLEDGCYMFESVLVAKQVVSTDSTVTLGWTITPENVPYLDCVDPRTDVDYTADIKHSYKVALYSDAACQNLVVSLDKISGSIFHATLRPTRIIVGGLEPATTYYAKVWDLTAGYESTVVEVATTSQVANKANVVTANATSGDLLLYENFSSLIFMGDVTSRAAGVSHKNRSNLTSFDGAEIKGELEISDDAFYYVSCSTEVGLFNNLAQLLGAMDLDKWGWVGGSSSANGGSVSVRNGYVRIGTSNNRASLVTPALDAIPAGKVARLKVVFKALPYVDASNAAATQSERFVSVKALTTPTYATNNKVTYQTVADENVIELTSELGSEWKEYEVSLSGVPSGAAVAIGGGAVSATATNRIFVDDIRIYVEAVEAAPAAGVATGYIKYSDGTPAAGVSVSDGFSVVATDQNGKYTLTPNQDAWYIYYTVPADCQVPINSYGQPAFFTKYEEGRTNYNFTLTKLPGGKETKFTLFCLADPQCKDATHRGRFTAESVPDIKKHAQSKYVPCYGVTLGDVTYSEGNRNCVAQMPYLRDHMAKDRIGMPIFQTMGNHDYTYFKSGSPIEPDETSSTYNMKAQRAFEDVFGPIDYSWDRGDVHIVCMRNMQWNADTDAADYTMKFTPAQYKWLKQDLALVSKDKMVIMCVHIPFASYPYNSNVQNVMKELNKFKEAHIMSGHTHYNRNKPTVYGKIYEHVHAAVCGNWWWSNTNGDGTPNGYGVYDINGSTITNWYYKGVNNAMADRDYQFRLYRGNIKTGGEYEQFQLQHGDGVLIANVFNYDSSWTIKVYEDGVYTGNMTQIDTSQEKPAYKENVVTKPNTSSSQDWWAIGYHVGVVGRGHAPGGDRSNYLQPCHHMFKYTLQNKNAAIRVEATDRFGRVYSSSEIVGDYDYTLMEY